MDLRPIRRRTLGALLAAALLTACATPPATDPMLPIDFVHGNGDSPALEDAAGGERRGAPLLAQVIDGAGRAVVGEFRSGVIAERIVGRTWPAEDGHVTVLELHE